MAALGWKVAAPGSSMSGLCCCWHVSGKGSSSLFFPSKHYSLTTYLGIHPFCLKIQTKTGTTNSLPRFGFTLIQVRG